MKRFLKQALLFAALAVAFNLLTVALLPRLINAVVMHKIASAGVKQASKPGEASDLKALPGAELRRAAIIAKSGRNVAMPADRADARARTVVRPSPDLLYTVCVFDLSEGDLHITGPVPGSYASVAGFAADTSNFFAVNDQTLGSDGQKLDRFDLLLTPAGSRQPASAKARVIEAPSSRGIVLFRTLITDEAALPRLRTEVQAQQHCELMPHS